MVLGVRLEAGNETLPAFAGVSSPLRAPGRYDVVAAQSESCFLVSSAVTGHGTVCDHERRRELVNV